MPVHCSLYCSQSCAKYAVVYWHICVLTRFFYQKHLLYFYSSEVPMHILVSAIFISI